MNDPRFEVFIYMFIILITFALIYLSLIFALYLIVSASILEIIWPSYTK